MQSCIFSTTESVQDNLDIKMLKRVSSDSKVFNISLRIDDKECKTLTEQRHVCKTNLPDDVPHQIRLVHNVRLFSIKPVKESMESSIQQDVK